MFNAFSAALMRVSAALAFDASAAAAFFSASLTSLGSGRGGGTSKYRGISFAPTAVRKSSRIWRWLISGSPLNCAMIASERVIFCMSETCPGSLTGITSRSRSS